MRRRHWAACLCSLLVVACGDSGTEPSEETSLTVEILSGDGQSGVPGWELRHPLVIRVSDDSGAPVAGVRVLFQAVGGGFTGRSVATTSGLGLANTTWTLGPSEVRDQSVTVTPADGGASASFSGTALGPDESDMVVIRGALGPLKGVVLTSLGSELDVLGMLSSTDTVHYLPPDSPAGTGLVVFGTANRPHLAQDGWTSGVDTVEVTLDAPVAIDIDFHVRTGVFETQRAIMLTQLENTDAVWASEGAGMVVGEVTFEDDTDPTRDVHKSSSGICSNLTLGDAVQIDVVSTIDSGSFTGWGCWAGQIYMAAGTERFPYLLAHELGHTFTLVHTATGLMFPNQPGTVFRDGEIYRAHFHNSSVLNTIFGGQPTGNQRTCHAVPSPCLPEGLDLSSGVIAQDAFRPSLLDAVRFGPPVDGVGEGHRGHR